jgi:enoyl-CoA hydratase
LAKNLNHHIVQDDDYFTQQMPQHLVFETRAGRYGELGLITLNRPQQLNALTHAMTVSIREQLLSWAATDSVKAVCICGTGERAFSAGGDIRALYESRNQPEVGRQFFADEYALNECIYNFPKPYIAILNGLTMGGGAGVSINGSYRIATEKLTFAMPETGIGFFTDVGASYFLSRCPGKIGWYLGLTGATISAVDAYQLGLVDQVISSTYLANLMEILIQQNWSANWQEAITALLAPWTLAGTTAQLIQHREIIDRCFSQTSLEAIIAALNKQSDAWSKQTLQVLRTRSPTSLKVVLAQLNRGAQLDFNACMQMEHRIAKRFLSIADFYEGIRAAVIDKDRTPKWQPASLAEVDEQLVKSFFA